MVKQQARTQELLRERNAARRSRQVWLALTVIWAVVVGWAVWGLVGMATENDLVTWLSYLVPLAVLLVGTGIAWARLSRVERDLVATAEQAAT